MLYKLKTTFCFWIWTADLDCTFFAGVSSHHASGGVAHRGGGFDGGGGEMPCYMWEQNVALNPGCCRVLLRSWHCMVPRWGQARSVHSWRWRRCSRQDLLLREVHGQMPWFGAVWGCQSASLGLLKGHSPWRLWVITYCWNTWRLCAQQSLWK